MPIEEDVIKREILEGLQQVDETFVITDFYLEYAPENRRLICSFKATTETGEEVSEVIDYA